MPFSNLFLLTPVRKQKLISFYLNSFSHLPGKDDVFIDFSIIILYRDILISTPGCDICYYYQLRMLLLPIAYVFFFDDCLITNSMSCLNNPGKTYILGLSFKSLSTLNFHVFEYSAINLFMILFMNLYFTRI